MSESITKIVTGVILPLVVALLTTIGSTYWFMGQDIAVLKTNMLNLQGDIRGIDELKDLYSNHVTLSAAYMTKVELSQGQLEILRDTLSTIKASVAEVEKGIEGLRYSKADSADVEKVALQLSRMSAILESTDKRLDRLEAKKGS